MAELDPSASPRATRALVTINKWAAPGIDQAPGDKPP
jgi:hypothetical protein